MSFHHWIPSCSHSGVKITSIAVYAGVDIDGSPVYVGRANHEGDLIPCKIITSKNIGYVPYDGSEHRKTLYDVLCGSGFEWIKGSAQEIPINAILGGHTKDGELLFVGRAMFEGSMSVGKIHRSHGCMYIPHNGEEINIRKFEILCETEQVASSPRIKRNFDQKTEWVETPNSLPSNAVLAGEDNDGLKMYVGRVKHGNEFLPAKVIHSERFARAVFDGEEIEKLSYEILCGNFEWIELDFDANEKISNLAFPCGSDSGETLYIGRGYHRGVMCMGKIKPSDKVLYAPHDYSEVAIKHCEVLVSSSF